MNQTNPKINYLTEDYKLKAAYVTNHFSRMWTRFNFFLSIELALFGVLGYLLFDETGQYREALIYPVMLGILVSMLFFIVGRQDQKLVAIYREAVKDVSKRLSEAMESTDDYDKEFIDWVRDVPVGEQEIYIKKENIRYWKAFRITSLPAIMAVFSCMVWLLLGLYWWSLKM